MPTVTMSPRVSTISRQRLRHLHSGSALLLCSLALPFLALPLSPAAQAQTAVAPADDDDAAAVANDEDAPEWIKPAQRLLDNEKYKEAAVAVQGLLVSRPRNYGLHMMLGAAYLGQYYGTEKPEEELRLLRLARGSFQKARALAVNDSDALATIAPLLQEVQSGLSELQATDTPEEIIPPVAPPRPAPAKPAPAVAPPKVAPPVAVAPKPVEVPPAPAASVPTTPAQTTPAMSSNLPLRLPSPAVPIRITDAALVAKEAKNRKYPTHTAYDELAASYVQLGMYDDAARNYRSNATAFRQRNAIQPALIHEQYAARYENQVRLFVDRPLSQREEDALNTGATLEPPVGAYVGAFIDRDERLKDEWTSEYFQTHRTPEEFNALVGKAHSTFFMYASYGNVFPREWLERCKAAGVIPHLAWEPTAGLDKVQEDAYLINFAKECGKLNWPIFLRYASEMNGSWTKWGGNPTLYREKFRLVNRVFKKYAPRVATVWCVNSVPVETVMDYYPGDDGCDWVGINLYSVPFYERTKSKPGDLDSPSSFIQPIYDLFANRKPIALCEYASSQMHVSDNLQRIDFAVNKMSLLYGSLPRLFPRIKMVSWFDQNNLKYAPPERRVNDFSLTENGIVLNAYRSLIGSPYFVTGGPVLSAELNNNLTRAVPMPVAPDQNVRGVSRFSIWVKTPVARPQVFLQIGSKIVYAGKRPGVHIVDVDTSQIPTGRQNVTIAVYDDAGRFLTKQTTAMTFGRTRGEDTSPFLLTGTVKNYFYDRSGYVTALSLQTSGAEAYLHFGPEKAAALIEQFPVNGPLQAWVKADEERGQGHWRLVSAGEEMPLTSVAPPLLSDLTRLTNPAPLPETALPTVQTGKLTGVVANESGRILALVLDDGVLVRIPDALRGVSAPNQKPLLLTRGSEVQVTAVEELPLEGAVSGFQTRLVATGLQVGGLSASAVGLPVLTVKEIREISAAPRPVKTRGVAVKNLQSEGFKPYLAPLPSDSGTGRTRGGGLAPLVPTNGRPW